MQGESWRGPVVLAGSRSPGESLHVTGSPAIWLIFARCQRIRFDLVKNWIIPTRHYTQSPPHPTTATPLQLARPFGVSVNRVNDMRYANFPHQPDTSLHNLQHCKLGKQQVEQHEHEQQH